MDKKEATHRIVYIAQSRVEEFVRVDPKTHKIVAAGPMLQLYKGCFIDDVRQRKMVTKVEDLTPPVVAPADRIITLTDAE